MQTDQRRPIILGMAPSGRFPNDSWSDGAKTTMMLNWLLVGEWQSPRLKKIFQMENLSGEQTGVLNKELKYEDGIDEGSARAKIRSLVGSRALTNGRAVVMLGKKVCGFLAKELGDDKLTRDPYFRKPVIGRLANLHSDFSSYQFTAHVLWHPRRIFDRRNEMGRPKPLNALQVMEFRQVLTTLAGLQGDNLPSVEDFCEGRIRIPTYSSGRHFETTDEADLDCYENDQPPLEELDSDRDDFYRSSETGWFHDDEDEKG